MSKYKSTDKKDARRTTIIIIEKVYAHPWKIGEMSQRKDSTCLRLQYKKMPNDLKQESELRMLLKISCWEITVWGVLPQIWVPEYANVMVNRGPLYLKLAAELGRMCYTVTV